MSNKNNKTIPKHSNFLKLKYKKPYHKQTLYIKDNLKKINKYLLIRISSRFLFLELKYFLKLSLPGFLPNKKIKLSKPLKM